MLNPSNSTLSPLFGRVIITNSYPGREPTVVSNCMKSTHSIHRNNSLSHELRSEWVSEQANEWAQWSARAKRAVRSKRMSWRCEQSSEQRSKLSNTRRVDFLVTLPNVHSVHGHTDIVFVGLKSQWVRSGANEWAERGSVASGAKQGSEWVSCAREFASGQVNGAVP